MAKNLFRVKNQMLDRMHINRWHRERINRRLRVKTPNYSARCVHPMLPDSALEGSNVLVLGGTVAH